MKEVVFVADVLNDLHVPSFEKPKKHLTPIWCFCFTALNWNHTQLLMFWGSFKNPGSMKTVRNSSFLKSWGLPAFIRQQQYWYVALSCAFWHRVWWISKQSADRDLILLFPACHPIYPAISGDRKKKRVKCWVTLTWHKSCFVFGITKVGSIIHQDWAKGQRVFTKQWDNGFPVDGAERLQTHKHTSCWALQIICFQHQAYCCCCRLTSGSSVHMNWIFILSIKSGMNAPVDNYWKVNFYKAVTMFVFGRSIKSNWLCLRIL